jgi:hypothetical protein
MNQQPFYSLMIHAILHKTLNRYFHLSILIPCISFFKHNFTFTIYKRKNAKELATFIVFHDSCNFSQNLKSILSSLNLNSFHFLSNWMFIQDMLLHKSSLMLLVVRNHTFSPFGGTIKETKWQTT